jgi:hypothetical protein
MNQADEVKINALLVQGLACTDVFERTGQRAQFTAFQDQVDAFADECSDEDVKKMFKMVR